MKLCAMPAGENTQDFKLANLQPISLVVQVSLDPENPGGNVVACDA